MTWIGFDKLPNGDILFLSDTLATNWSGSHYAEKVSQIAHGVIFGQAGTHINPRLGHNLKHYHVGGLSAFDELDRIVGNIQSSIRNESGLMGRQSYVFGFVDGKESKIYHSTFDNPTFVEVPHFRIGVTFDPVERQYIKDVEQELNPKDRLLRAYDLTQRISEEDSKVTIDGNLIGRLEVSTGELCTYAPKVNP